MSIIKTKNINFVRWGALSQRKGKIISSDNFHKAPAKFGLYAFPEFFVESFLVDWKYCGDDKMDYNKLINYINKKFNTLYNNIDEIYDDENLMINNPIFDEIIKFETSEVKKIKYKEFKIFKYRGDVWHHFLNYSKSTIRSGSWVLDSYDDYITCLYKEIHECGKMFMNPKNYMTSLGIHDNIINGVKHYIGKDHFEVYLSDKIK